LLRDFADDVKLALERLVVLDGAGLRPTKTWAMNGSAATAVLPSEELSVGTSRQPSRSGLRGNDFGEFSLDRFALGGIFRQEQLPTPYWPGAGSLKPSFSAAPTEIHAAPG
jgi:hypothetical protein